MQRILVRPQRHHCPAAVAVAEAAAAAEGNAELVGRLAVGRARAVHGMVGVVVDIVAIY